MAVVDAFYSVPRGGVEIGGVFFGRCAGDSLQIQSYRPIKCQYLTGPSFKLSIDDQAELSTLLKLPASDPELAGLVAIGWYHSHNRSAIFLSPDDMQVYHEFFPEPWQIALVLRPAHMQPTRAGFFFRDALGSVQFDTPVQEFVMLPPGLGLTVLNPEGEEVIAQTAEASGVPPEVVNEEIASVPEPIVEEKVQPQAVLEIFASHDAGASTPPLNREFLSEVREPDLPEQTAATTASVEKTGWVQRWGRWIRGGQTEQERRSTKRLPGAGLMVFYWDGNLAGGRKVRDISKRGAFVETDFTWMRGTLIDLRLQIGSHAMLGDDRRNTITVTAEIVRTSPEGMGLRFVLPDFSHMSSFLRFLNRWNPDSISAK